MPAIPIIVAGATVAGAGAAVAGTVNQAKAQASAEKNAQQAQDQANAQAASDLAAQQAAQAQGTSGSGGQATPPPVNSPPPLGNSDELTHSIQALANATSEINAQKSTAPAFSSTQIILFGVIALVLILIIMRKK